MYAQITRFNESLFRNNTEISSSSCLQSLGVKETFFWESSQYRWEGNVDVGLICESQWCFIPRLERRRADSIVWAVAFHLSSLEISSAAEFNKALGSHCLANAEEWTLKMSEDSVLIWKWYRKFHQAGLGNRLNHDLHSWRASPEPSAGAPQCLEISLLKLSSQEHTGAPDWWLKSWVWISVCS